MKSFLLLLSLMVYCGLAYAECDKLDLVIILDGSASINTTEHDLVKTFLMKFANSTFGDIDLNIAWMSFGGTAFVQWAFNVDVDDYWGAQMLYKNNDISQIHLALQGAYTLFQEGVAVRSDARKAVILVTDGVATYPSETLEAAMALKDNGVLIITVGIGDEDAETLEKIASVEDYSFVAEPTAKMNEINQEIIDIFFVELCTDCDDVDALIILDGSASIGSDEHNETKYYLQDFAKQSFGGINLNIAWMSFGGTAFLQWGFNVNKTFPDHYGALSLYKNEDTSQLHLALKAARNLFKSGEGVRSTAQKVVILVTDGRPTKPKKAKKFAQRLTNDGVLLMTIGIGDVDSDALQELASYDEYSFLAKPTSKFTEINQQINEIFMQEFCADELPLCKPPPGEVFFDMKSRYDRDGSANRFHFQCALIGERATKEISIFKRNHGGSEEEIARLTSDGLQEFMDYIDTYTMAIDCSNSTKCEEGDSSFLWIVLNRYNHVFVFVDDSAPEFQKFGCRITDEFDHVQEMTEIYRVREPENTLIDASKKAENLVFLGRPGFDFDDDMEYVSMRCSVTALPLPIEIQIISPDGTVLGRLYGASETDKWDGDYKRLKVLGDMNCSAPIESSDPRASCEDGEYAYMITDIHHTSQQYWPTDDYPYYHPKCVLIFEGNVMQEQARYNRMAILHPEEDE